MKTGTWRLGAVLLVVLTTFGIIAAAQGVTPLGIIPTPPENTDLEVRVWVDQGAYTVGEPITIHYSVNEPAYVYIWDVLPDGTAVQIFPNASFGQTDNFVLAGEHTLQGTIAPPYGTEYVQILATTSPVNPFAFFTTDPEAFRQMIEAQILGILPPSERSWDFTSFEIVSSPPPTYATLIINSVPGGALAFIDGTYVGYTPRTVLVSQGFHRLTLTRPGYEPWEAALFLIGGRTRTVDATLTPLLVLNLPPVAAFTHTPATPGLGEWIQFDGSASADPDGTVDAYAWDFGDGSTGAGSVMWHRYTTPGTYLVTLTVTDDDGATDSTTITVQVGPTNLPPVAAFSFSPSNPMAGGWVQFDGSASADPDGTITTYAWDFGDGSSDTGPAVWHRYATVGTYLVTLTVTDDDGATNSTTQTIQVGSTNVGPNAAFSFTPVSPGIGEWIRFDATASVDPDGTITNYGWNFGDGSPTTTGSVVYHQYSAAGTYTVTLTVTDDDGASDTATSPVQVGPVSLPPVAAFTYAPLDPEVGEAIVFDATSSFDPDGAIVQYSWDVDGNGSDDLTGPVITINYTSSGVVVVRLTVTDNSGLTAVATQPVVVSAPGLPLPPTTPPMGTTPGIFVWGDDTWHITVNAGAGWPAARAYELELRTDGSFQNVNQSSGGVVPLGIIPTPTDAGKTLLFDGSLQSGSVDYSFTVNESESIWMSLKLDIDGDGDLDESRSFVYLRGFMVNPPNAPFVVGLPEGSPGPLIPSMNFRVGSAISYTSSVRFVIWSTTIEDLETP